jgi:hypothetical protein
MTYDVSLFAAGLVVGLILIAGHLPALIRPELTKQWLLDFPRSLFLGRVFLVVAVAWCIWLILTMDLGEFAAVRHPMAIAAFFCGVLTWIFVEEFLSVRALSILFLLAADVLLCAAFLQPPVSRLWLVFLAYAWILGGLFCVGLPWLMRDALAWFTKSDWRLRLAAAAGVAYGLLLVISAAAFWR